MDCKTITLRTRVLKHGMLGFYLDFYPGYRDRETMKVYRHKSIDIQIYAEPKNQREKNFNAQMTEKAEAIRCRIPFRKCHFDPEMACEPSRKRPFLTQIVPFRP